MKHFYYIAIILLMLSMNVTQRVYNDRLEQSIKDYQSMINESQALRDTIGKQSDRVFNLYLDCQRSKLTTIKNK